MTPELRAELDRIDSFLLRNDQNASELWNVLSALRGPDNADDDVKFSLTCPIRAAAFPLTANHAKYYGSSNGAFFHDPYGHTPQPSVFPGQHRDCNAGYHFWGHIKYAAIALGLYNADQE